MRLVQISDTHVSRTHRHFAANVAVLHDWVRAQSADLIVNTGDLSMNGAVVRQDLDDAAAWHGGLGLPVLSVPGNHDVGDLPELRADQVLNDRRLARFREIAGDDRWAIDQDGWRLLGLNAMLFGTGHRDEIVQYEWLEDAFASAAPTAVFLHKPLFVSDPDEGPHGYWTVPPGPRRRLLGAMRRADVRLVASGHLHVAREATFEGVRHVWGPSAAFVCGDIQPATVPGERRVGAVVHDFTPDDVSSRIVFLEDHGAENLPLDPYLETIYPAPPPLEALSA